MNEEVDDANDQGGEEQRRNVLYDNASVKKVNVIGNDRQEIEDNAVHDKYAKPEREDDDRAEYQRENWL
jgi:hypothetical protein